MLGDVIKSDVGYFENCQCVVFMMSPLMHVLLLHELAAVSHLLGRDPFVPHSGKIQSWSKYGV